MVDTTHKRFIASDRSYFSIIKKEIHEKAAAAGEILAGSFTDGTNHYIELISIETFTQATQNQQ